MIIEVAAVLAVLIGGSACCLVLGLRGWPVPAIGYIVGTALLILIGWLQIVTRAPTSPVLTLALTAGLPAAAWVLALRQQRPVGFNPLPATIVAAGATAAVIALSAAQLVTVTPDSFRYVGVGSLIASNHVNEVAPFTLETRLIAVPLVHAPANLGDALYLAAVTPLLAVATLAVLFCLCREGLRHQAVPGSVVTLAAALGAALLITNSRFLFHAVYINGHLLFGALLLLAVGAPWLAALMRPDRFVAAAPLQVLALATLVVVRPEGSLVAGLALLPTVLDRRVPLRARMAPMLGLGISMMVWYGYLVVHNLADGRSPPLPVLVLLGVGFGLVVAAVLASRLVAVLSPVLLTVAEIGLWVALLVAFVLDPHVLIQSVGAALANALVAGGWGISLVMLSGMVVAVLLVTDGREQVYLRFPLTTFVPLSALLAYMREGAYRIGPGDSLNRMLFHFMPVAVLLVVSALGSERWGFQRSQAHRAEGEAPSRLCGD